MISTAARVGADHRVGERVYQEVRRRLLAGEFRLRERIDPAGLADALAVSTTPVREAMVRLMAERLLTLQPSRGFFLRLWSEAELRALYEWRSFLLLSASPPAAGGASVTRTGPYASRVAALWAQVEAASNPELREAGMSADTRLFFAHGAEAAIFDDIELELDRVSEAVTAASRPLMLRRLRAYHGRRLAAVRAIRERALLALMPPNGG